MPRQPDIDRAALAAFIARVFPGEGWQAERTAAGVSTPVYRVWRDGETRYLRLAESATASLAPEVRAHALLRERGVRVPMVLHYEAHDAALGRSALVTTEIPGARRLRRKSLMAIGWQHDVEAARERARGERKLVFVDIWSDT